jgi:hypothetical protein
MAKRASKPKSRLEKRKENEAAEKLAADKPAAEKKKSGKKKAEGAAAKPKTTKKKSKKAENVRLRMMWGIFDNSNQQVATFPYAQKAAAEARLAELLEKGRGTFFINPVREPIVESEPVA